MSSTLRLTLAIPDDLSVELERISGDEPPDESTDCENGDGIYTASFGIEGTYIARFYDADSDRRFIGYVRLIDGQESDVMDTLKATEDPVVAPVINYDDLSSSVALRVARVAYESEALPNAMISVARGTTWRIPIGEIPESWKSIDVTVRKHDNQLQSQSLVHVHVTNPEDEDNDGLLVFNGSSEVDAEDGSVSISEVDRTATCLIQATSNGESPTGTYCFDAKLTTEDGVDQIARGDVIVEEDVSRL